MPRAALDHSRYAIVIGNNDYEGKDKLKWAEWDAHRMQEELEARGFSVFHYVNMTGVGMKFALESFCGKLRSRSCMRAGQNEVHPYATTCMHYHALDLSPPTWSH